MDRYEHFVPIRFRVKQDSHRAPIHKPAIRLHQSIHRPLIETIDGFHLYQSAGFCPEEIQKIGMPGEEELNALGLFPALGVQWQSRLLIRQLPYGCPNADWTVCRLTSPLLGQQPDGYRCSWMAKPPPYLH